MSTDHTVGDGAGHRPAPFRPDLCAGAAFVVLGLAFAIGGSRYDVGSALRMGSGYVPLALGGLGLRARPLPSRWAWVWRTSGRLN